MALQVNTGRDAHRSLTAGRCTDQLAHLARAQAALEERVERRHARREQWRLREAGGEHLPRRAHRLHAGRGDGGGDPLELRVIEAATLACEELEVAGEQPLDGGRAGAKAFAQLKVSAGGDVTVRGTDRH